MQTFLPYEDFAESAACLDRQRLGKQRVETLQILRTLLGDSSGWDHHPAVLMWDGHTDYLVEYGLEVCEVWMARGYEDNILLQILRYHGHPSTEPLWLGNSEFHRSHQSNLLRKNPDHYSQFGWDVPNDLPYIWPL